MAAAGKVVHPVRIIIEAPRASVRREIRSAARSTMPKISPFGAVGETKFMKSDFPLEERVALKKDQLDFIAVKGFTKKQISKEMVDRYPSVNRVERNYQFCKDIVLQARNPHSRFKKLPYLKFQRFLNIPANKKWFAIRLVMPPTKETDELWAGGAHEWLERHEIDAVMARSAGMKKDIRSEVEGIDWLDIQFGLRTPVNIIFHGPGYIESGHTPAVKERAEGESYKGLKGAKTAHSKEFHFELDRAFESSRNPCGYVKSAHRIFHDDCLQLKTELPSSPARRRISLGSLTDDRAAINAARLHPLVRGRFHDTALRFQQFKAATRFGSDGDDVESVTSTVTRDAGGGIAAGVLSITGDRVTATTNGYQRVFETNGDKYFGELHNGQRHGYGKLLQSNGDRYYGYWKNGQKHGRGIQIVGGVRTPGYWRDGEHKVYIEIH